jgi:hypothetical protein
VGQPRDVSRICGLSRQPRSAADALAATSNHRSASTRRLLTKHSS